MVASPGGFAKFYLMLAASMSILFGIRRVELALCYHCPAGSAQREEMFRICGAFSEDSVCGEVLLRGRTELGRCESLKEEKAENGLIDSEPEPYGLARL